MSALKTFNAWRKTPEGKEWVQVWNAAHREDIRASSRRWTANNREKVIAKDARYAASGRKRVVAAAYYAANADTIKARVKAWKMANFARVHANVKRRESDKLRATPRWANLFFVEEAYHLARLRTEVTGFPWHVDHVIPLRSPRVCGLHVETNIRVIPAIINLKKGNWYWPDMPGSAEERVVH